VIRGNLRLLLAGPKSSAGRPMPDGRKPGPGGWNRIHFVVDDITADVGRLRAAGVHFRNDIVTGPGGQQILLNDPSGNPIELFQPAAARWSESAHGIHDRGRSSQSPPAPDQSLTRQAGDVARRVRRAFPTMGVPT
jgi:hypothetical protein